MPPQIGKADYSGDVNEQGGGGGFFSQKLGPLPLWVVIAGAIVIVYALYRKFAGGTSSSTPTVLGGPTDTTPYGNLQAALSEILANQQAISAVGGNGVPNNYPGSAGNPNPPTATSGNGQPLPAESGPNFNRIYDPGSGFPANSGKRGY